MGRVEGSQPILLRDQQRALHAYEAVARVPESQRSDYQIAVNGLGANIIRSGLCSALAEVQRLGKRGELLLEHLASAGVVGPPQVSAKELFAEVRKLNAEDYMIATRELIAVATWLKRAVQGTFTGD